MDYLDNYKLQIFCNKPSLESLMVYSPDSGSNFDTSPNFINNDEITDILNEVTNNLHFSSVLSQC